LGALHGGDDIPATPARRSSLFPGLPWRLADSGDVLPDFANGRAAAMAHPLKGKSRQVVLNIEELELKCCDRRRIRSTGGFDGDPALGNVPDREGKPPLPGIVQSVSTVSAMPALCYLTFAEENRDAPRSGAPRPYTFSKMLQLSVAASESGMTCASVLRIEESSAHVSGPRRTAPRCAMPLHATATAAGADAGAAGHGSVPVSNSRHQCTIITGQCAYLRTRSEFDPSIQR
jgi:hypothetical protein